MKQSIKTITLGVLAGFLGAFLFSLFQSHIHSSAELSSQLPHEEASLVNNRIDKTAKSSMKVDFTDASAISTKSVVYIKTISSKQYNRHTWFDLFFEGRGRMTERQALGSGSGVIFSEDGYIVTNNHVIEGADDIQVIHDKKTYVAKVIGKDPSSDLALLKIEGKNLPAIPIGSSRNLKVGEWVLAVGNPFNLTSTVTAGIVSAKGRNINILEDIFPIESFIQTDAAINPGNSGGALVNKEGKLVGINTAILSRTGSYAGYGFAVPADIVMKVINDLKQYGEVQKAFMGIEAADLTEEDAKQKNLSSLDGVAIQLLEADGAAAKAGLQEGDIIVQVDAEKVSSKTAFDEQLSYYRPGDKVTVQYLRNGKNKTANITLTNIYGDTKIVKREVYESESLGAEFEIVPKVERQRMGIESGIRLKKVYRGLIQRMGIEEGFVITSINNRQIENPEELTDILEKIRGRVVIQGVDKNGTGRYYSFYF
ncbi:MAG: S1C family serine protease [Flammeovirgaceae bacterium]